MSLEDPLTLSEAEHLRRQVQEFIELFDGLLDSIMPEVIDAAHFQAGAVEIMIDPIAMRAVAEVIRQLNVLPGKPPSVPLVPLTHAAL